jgi:hypothetical protein
MRCLTRIHILSDFRSGANCARVCPKTRVVLRAWAARGYSQRNEQGSGAASKGPAQPAARAALAASVVPARNAFHQLTEQVR